MKLAGRLSTFSVLSSMKEVRVVVLHRLQQLELVRARLRVGDGHLEDLVRRIVRVGALDVADQGLSASDPMPRRSSGCPGSSGRCSGPPSTVSSIETGSAPGVKGMVPKCMASSTGAFGALWSSSLSAGESVLPTPLGRPSSSTTQGGDDAVGVLVRRLGVLHVDLEGRAGFIAVRIAQRVVELLGELVLGAADLRVDQQEVRVVASGRRPGRC